MKLFIFLIVLFHAYFSFADQLEELTPSFIFDSIKKDKSLNSTEAAITFSFKNIQLDGTNKNIRYSINGKNGVLLLNAKNKYSFTVKPGRYKFQFYCSGQYEEIYTDSILAEKQSRSYVSLYWQYAYREIMVDKPVIYLYPEIASLVEVKVKPQGEFTFTYPEYKNGWKVTAEPSGELKINNSTYNYLFWEASQRIGMDMIDLSTGFTIEGDKSLDFLEEKLSLFGLNSKEKADFITFWAPQLQQNKLNFVHFIFNDDANSFAELEITPQPDHVYRIYLLSFPLESEDKIRATEQEIPKIDRSGFTVIEWGGSQIKTLHSSFNFN